MAGSLNKIILIGNAGKDPELKITPGGAKIARFSLATNESWKDKNTGERKTKTEWHNIVLWNKGAELAEKLIRKGKMVMIEGKVTYTTDQNDQTKRYTNIEASNFILLDKRDAADSHDGSGGGSDEDSHQNNTPQDNNNGYDDDIPFW